MAGTMQNIEGKHALVTGGGSGIGAAIAQALSREGATVSLVGRSIGKLEHAQQELSLSGGVASADVSNPEQVAAALSSLREAHGAFGIVVNNAGAAESAPFQSMSFELWQSMLAVNLTGTFLVTQATLEDVKNTSGGRIVNIASTASLKGYAYVSAYCAAKHGVLGLTRALALELARKDVTVNAVCPGYTQTDLLDRSVSKITGTTGLSESEARERLSAGNPQGRFVTAEEVADTVTWLCGEAARSVTGQAIAVAGGEVM